MPAPDSTCHETVVRNATGGTRFFGFLPPHGKRLANGETFTYPGDLEALLMSNTKKRQRDSYLRALGDGSLQLLRTPSPIYFDAVYEQGRTMEVSNGVVRSVAECWVGSSAVPPDPLLTGLEAYYRLDGDLTDSSGNGRDLTPTSPTYSAAILGNGLATGYGTVAWSPSVTCLTSDFTLSAWLNTVAGTSLTQYRWGAYWGMGSLAFQYNAKTGSSRGVQLYVPGHIDSLGTFGSSLTSNTWVHVVGTWDYLTQTRTIWVDGVEHYSEVVADASGAAVTPIWVRARGDAGFFDSPIDEVGFWTRKLTADEIATLYNAGIGYDPTA